MTAGRSLTERVWESTSVAPRVSPRRTHKFHGGRNIWDTDGGGRSAPQRFGRQTNEQTSKQTDRYRHRLKPLWRDRWLNNQPNMRGRFDVAGFYFYILYFVFYSLYLILLQLTLLCLVVRVNC